MTHCGEAEVGYLLLEDEHIAGVGLAAEAQALGARAHVQLGEVAGAHVARLLRADDLVALHVEARRAPGRVQLACAHRQRQR